MADRCTAGAGQRVRGESGGAQMPERVLRRVHLDGSEHGTGWMNSLNTKLSFFLPFLLFLIIKMEMSFYDILIIKL